MDHYEELGLDRSASVGQVRQAYKQLARLLHPDQCQDAAVRRLADLQMKRLNQIVQTLSSSAARKSYDRSLALPHAPVSWRPSPRRNASFVWIAGTILFLASLAFFPLTPRSTRVESAPKENLVPSPATAVPEAPRRRSKRPFVARQPIRPPSPQSLPDPEAPEPLPLQAMTPQAMTLPPQAIVEPPSPTGPSPPTHAQPSPTDGLAGEWLYVGTARKRSRDLYQPEYIELRLTRHEGKLRGAYHARYRVPDQAISPVVAFQFEAPASFQKGLLPWRGPDGAEGEVTLTPRSNQILEVTWLATRMGADLGLASGKANLVRKAD
jgi:hypothetical protein